MAKDLRQAGVIEHRAKERDKLCAEFQAITDEWLNKYKALIVHDHETFSMLHQPDCLLGDSPISVLKTGYWLREHIQKNCVVTWSPTTRTFNEKESDGDVRINCFSWIGFTQLDFDQLKSFVERSSDATKWILKFTKAPEPKKTGLEAIL